MFKAIQQVRASPKTKLGIQIPAQSFRLLWLQVIGLQMAAQKLLGFQNWSFVLLSSMLKFSRGSDWSPSSLFLGQSLPSLSCSFHLVPIGTT